MIHLFAALLAMFSPLVVDGDSISAYATVTVSPPPLPCQSGYAPTTTCWPDQVAATIDSSNVTNLAAGGMRMTGPSGIFVNFATKDLPYCGTNSNIFLWDIGANDLTAFTTGSDLTARMSVFLGEYRSIIGQCLASGTVATSIYVLNLTPIPGNVADAQMVPVWNQAIALLPLYFPGLHLIDVYDPMVALCQPITVCFWDAIHPDIMGDTIMTITVLQALAQ